MHNSAPKPANPGPKLSGPHICVQAGKYTLNLVDCALSNAADMRGGKLSKHDIKLVLEFIRTSQEMFDFFRDHYAACGRLHKNQTFVPSSKEFFAQSVARFYCYDAVRKVFATQIKHCPGNWELVFISAGIAFFSEHVDPEFKNRLSKAYHTIANESGFELDAVAIANHESVRAIMKDSIQKLPTSHADLTRLSEVVNKAMSNKFNDFGPSPIKVSEPILAKFFEQLKNPQEATFFRKQILD